VITRLHAVPAHHRDGIAVGALTGVTGVVFAAADHPRLALAAGGLMCAAAAASLIGGRTAHRKRADART
jgi:hypothetical protein